jgi:hypothetical protein
MEVDVPEKRDDLVGVYDADATLIGEVAYWVGARLGVRHCALCDVTHGTFRRRRDWDCEVARIHLPFTTFHRNDAPHDVLAACGGALPAVLRRTGDRVTVLLGPDEIARCASSPAALVDRILLHLEN